VAGRAGQAVEFTNSNQGINIQKNQATPPLLQTTIAAWVKGSGAIVSRQADLALTTTDFTISAVNMSSGTPVTTTRTLPIPSGNAIDPAQWTHVAVTFSGAAGGAYDEQGNFHPYAQIHLYINGQAVAADLNGPVGSLEQWVAHRPQFCRPA
jgi:hypothetical protein